MYDILQVNIQYLPQINAKIMFLLSHNSYAA